MRPKTNSLPPAAYWSIAIIASLSFIALAIYAIHLSKGRHAAEQALQTKNRAEAQQAAAIRQQTLDYFNKNSSQILNEVITAFKNNNFYAAVALSDKYLPTQNQELIDLNTKAKRNFLFQKEGYWIGNIASRSGLKCSEILAQSAGVEVFKSFTPESKLYFIRVGDKHPAAKKTREALDHDKNGHIPIDTMIIESSPMLRIKLTAHTYNGASIEEFIEVNPAANTITDYAVGRCINCNESQQKVNQNFKAHVSYWCRGKVD